MAFKCFECKYDCNVWCETQSDDCTGCERLNDNGGCECMRVDLNNCPDFVPKGDSNASTH